MKLIRGLSHLKPFSEGCVLTIGNFDGLHLGHREVIKKLVARGETLGLPVVIMIFEPQPLEYFLKDNEPARLSALRDKAIQFSGLPVDYLLIARFNRHFANVNAEQFVDDILIGQLNVKHLVIGDDFHFGKARRGNFALLQDKGRVHGFTVEDTGSFSLNGLRVSSTLIRDALAVGDLAKARQMLGHSFAICGRVAHGDKRGRTLGFPTANIKLFRKNTPINGVFAVTLTGLGGQAYQGVANVGTRPTVDGSTKVLLETHIFDFDAEIYGRYVEVHFQHKLRNEQRFASVTELQRQILQDVAAAKAWFEMNL